MILVQVSQQVRQELSSNPQMKQPFFFLHSERFGNLAHDPDDQQDRSRNIRPGSASPILPINEEIAPPRNVPPSAPPIPLQILLTQLQTL